MILRRRSRPDRDAPAPWALLSFLLRYPDERVADARDELAVEVAALPDGPVRESLERFLERFTGDATQLAARYVETFDLRRRNSLHLTYYAHGDTRERGMALLRLKKLYRSAGLPLEAAHMPDDLTVMLAFAAVAPPGHGEALLAEHRAAIELVRLSLHDIDSPYADVLDAVAALLAPLTVSERAEVAKLAREGPPEDAVGLEPYGPPEAMPEGAPDTIHATGRSRRYAGGRVE
ncbi:MAG: nitrate reductase molybdenum cofactor assembly chaperone [Solirubrobacterales bacterium]